MFFKRKKSYRISVDQDDLVTPEETLLDSRSQYSDIEMPIPGSVFRLFLFLFGIFGILVIGSVYKLAILDHDAYSKLALQNRSADFPLSPPRGIIFDRNGNPLVKNLPSFNLLAVTREIKENSEQFDDSIAKITAIM